ncbi:nitrilase-related carbon-nitrogen hydrolase [Labilibaculum manganireducens]|uniref:nitrilase-related carbon-nitrogen hydrolase n=1 Tax=Labilibaculum manganireducens TaxID=1940525 RepID=UPI0029F55B03|nr:nitrilase-related carbon-nitrogen hydrolase [Labilibaculum manganireducens]
MKIALIQFAPVFGDLQSTIKSLRVLFFRAKEADLVVLPELSNTGYNFDSKEEAFELSETVKDSVFLDFIQESCLQHNFTVATGFSEKDGDQLYNSAVLMNATGLVGTYRKLHLFMNEKNIFEKGNLGLPVFIVDDVKIGILVCFDWMFPEVWRKLALQGVDLILHPSNLVLPYAQSVIPSYALVNRIFIATANRIGTEKELSFTGQSVIVNPKGEVIAKADKLEQILFVDIDPELARDKMITKNNNVFKDRRTDIYE